MELIIDIFLKSSKVWSLNLFSFISLFLMYNCNRNNECLEITGLWKNFDDISQGIVVENLNEGMVFTSVSNIKDQSFDMESHGCFIDVLNDSIIFTCLEGKYTDCFSLKNCNLTIGNVKYFKSKYSKNK